MARKPHYLSILNKRQQVFVEVYVQSGSASAACEAAGFSPGNATALMQNPRVAEAIRMYTAHTLQLHGPIGLRVLKEIAEGEKVPVQYRLLAAKDLLDRATGKAAQLVQVDINVNASVKEEELLDRITELQRELGLLQSTPIRLLASPTASIEAEDAEYSEIDDLEAENG